MTHEHDGGSEAGVHGHTHDEPRASIRAKALESLLIEKGIISTDAIDAVVRAYEHDIGPLNGARVVARAWSDPAYRERLLNNGTEAIAKMGYMIAQGAEIAVIENTADTHNMVVCTLCSCYPWAVLGLPPTWYKSAAYRSRAVIEPRAVLQEFGVTLDSDVNLKVWDSTAEIRYMVLPERPDGTEGLSEDELAHLVSRDSMIGVALVAAPERTATV